ncbi:early nodulin-like protein 1 [Tripterygium wilfordii]|uniref:early nodulin-like protein 1 n=1 Tax=Tripterygium wilfordii TaxID=458696 RepID=UPI0018F8167E|nr:early nodulin-like protein 1 [Tripterygium wilfordii]
MESQRLLGFILMVTVTGFLFFSSSQAYKFWVGGKAGWVLNPSENYNHWAERSRFRVNDTLYFRYKKGSDSVLVVTKEDYFSCNTTKPLQSFTDGESTFKFDRWGPFFFISGQSNNCNNGQKLITVVMAPRNGTSGCPTPPTPPKPSPVAPAQPPKAGHSPAPSPNNEVDAPAPAPAKAGAVGLVNNMGFLFESELHIVGDLKVRHQRDREDWTTETFAGLSKRKPSRVYLYRTNDSISLHNPSTIDDFSKSRQLNASSFDTN